MSKQVFECQIDQPGIAPNLRHLPADFYHYANWPDVMSHYSFLYKN